MPGRTLTGGDGAGKRVRTTNVEVALERVTLLPARVHLVAKRRHRGTKRRDVREARELLSESAWPEQPRCPSHDRPAPSRDPTSSGPRSACAWFTRVRAAARAALSRS